jgi:hypothetical protein
MIFFWWYPLTWLSVRSLVVLRCMTWWSCAQQPIIEMLSVGETHLVNRPMMLVWGHAISVKWLACKYVQGLRCDTQTGHVVCLRCITCWLCAQHNMVMSMLLLSCQWSSNWGYYPGNLYLALLLIPCDELGKASLCQTEGLHQKLHMHESCPSSDMMCRGSTWCLKFYS